MTGVAGPMYRRSHAAGRIFVLGLLAGGLVGVMFLALIAYLLNSGLRALVPEYARWWIFAGGLVVLGVSDMINRTLHVWRQVPQGFVRRLPPGRLGVVWGADLGLLFTTQKTSSLLWAAIPGSVFVHYSVLLFPAIVIVYVLCVWLRSVGRDVLRKVELGGHWLRVQRMASGLVLLLMAAASFDYVTGVMVI